MREFAVEPRHHQLERFGTSAAECDIVAWLAADRSLRREYEHLANSTAPWRQAFGKLSRCTGMLWLD